MNLSTPGLPVHHQLPEFTQTHVHWVSDAIQTSHPVVLFSSRLQSFPASGSFPISQFFASGGQSIGISILVSVLPMNIQDWFPWGLTGWISLQSKGLSRVFPNATVQKHQFFGAAIYGVAQSWTRLKWRSSSSSSSNFLELEEPPQFMQEGKETSRGWVAGQSLQPWWWVRSWNPGIWLKT